MRLQVIKSVDGRDEYVLLPITVYQSLREEIEEELIHHNDADYVPFDAADYIDNPIALARIKSRMTQEELAKRLQVSQAYISKIEAQKKVTPKLLERVNQVLLKP
jgi:ribosome-binding protein aMBF1 (putative translation factor)